MRASIVLFVLFLLCLAERSWGLKKKPSECEQVAHVGLTVPQKQRLCAPVVNSGSGTNTAAATGNTGIGPAACANVAKTMHLDVESLMRLCVGAANSAPAECMKSLSSRQRKDKTVGMALCVGVSNPLRENCFTTLTSSVFRGAHSLKQEQVMGFCTDPLLEDAGPVSCLQAVAEVNLGQLLPASLGLDREMGCLQASLFSSPAGTSRNLTTGKPLSAAYVQSLGKRSLLSSSLEVLESLSFWRNRRRVPGQHGSIIDGSGKRLAILACLQEMAHSVVSGSVRAYQHKNSEVLHLCMHSSLRNLAPDAIQPGGLFGLLDRGLEKVQNDPSKRGKQFPPRYFRSYLAECAVRATNITRADKERVDEKNARNADTSKKGRKERMEEMQQAEKRGDSQHADLPFAPVTSTNPPLMSAGERVKLCEGIDSLNGPVNCVKHVLGRTDVPLSPEDLIHLCNGAGGIDSESANKVRAEARWEEIRLKRSRSKNRRVREEAQKAKNRFAAQSYFSMGLGPALCFLDSKGMGLSKEQRFEICVGAESSGPSQCYRRSSGGIMRVSTHEDRLLLCVGAESTDPAECAQNAPHYLDLAEKLHVCAGTPPGRAGEPITCLKAVDGPARMLKDAPKKSIGSFSIHIKDESDRHSREILLHMCSFDGSKSPVAAAECLKSAPSSLVHDSVVRTCTNSSSADVFSRISLCSKLLPRQWTYEEAVELCSYEGDDEEEEEGEEDITLEGEGEDEEEPESEEEKKERLQLAAQERDERAKTKRQRDKVRAARVQPLTQAVVQCAVLLEGHQTYRAGDSNSNSDVDSSSSGGLNHAHASVGQWTKAEASALCRRETEAGLMLKCVKEAQASPSASPAHNAQFISPRLVTQVCHTGLKASSGSLSPADITKAKAKAVRTGGCLTRLAAAGSSKRSDFGPGVVHEICGASEQDPSFTLSCLEEMVGRRTGRQAVEVSDIQACLNIPREVRGAEYVNLVSHGDNAPFATAGDRFSVTFGLLDQFGKSFAFPSHAEEGIPGSRRDVRDMYQSCDAIAETGTDGRGASVSIDEGNQQGAVIWGGRYNSSYCGTVAFDNLIITQPGPITLTLTASKEQGGHILAVATLNVRVNPELGAASSRCLWLFREGMCSAEEQVRIGPAKGEEQEQEGEKGISLTTQMYVPTSEKNYLRFLTCLPTWEKWHVKAFTDGASVGFFVEFRTGIDSIWTGRDLPRDEMGLERRLGLPRDVIRKGLEAAEAAAVIHDNANVDKSTDTGSRRRTNKESKKRYNKVSKQIRRAYYRKSLQWHPDRWVGMNTYTPVVQAAFEAITHAHEGLQQELEHEMERLSSEKELKEKEREKEKAEREAKEAIVLEGEDRFE